MKDSDSIVIRTDKDLTDTQCLVKQLQDFFKGSEFEVSMISKDIESMSGFISKEHAIQLKRKEHVYGKYMDEC